MLSVLSGALPIYLRTSDDYFCNRMFFHSYHLYKLRLVNAIACASYGAMFKDGALPSGVAGEALEGAVDMIVQL